jgi:LPS-assembly protein
VIFGYGFASPFIKHQGDGKKKTEQVETTHVCMPYVEGGESAALGWVYDANNLCGGHYVQKTLHDTPLLNVTADNFSLKADGRSTVSGNVVVKSKLKELSGDTAYIYRDKGKVKRIELLGHVVMNEPLHLMRARRGTYYPENGSGKLHDALYRMLYGNDKTAWGRACLIHRDTKGNVHLKDVSYSTCPPQIHTWEIKARKIDLNKAESRGVARDATFYLYQLPLLYTPYLSFPLDNRRKSGFLVPRMGYASQNGFNVLTPYYLNLAPNYDATLLPHYYSLRGVMLGAQFRYLLFKSLGAFEGHFLPSDRAFKQFKLENIGLDPALSDVSDNRFSIKWDQKTAFSKNLHLQMKYQQVSDNYYLQDFVNTLSLASTNQLERILKLTYQDTHWTFSSMVQNYQTLHPFNQPPVLGAYSRTPQLRAYGQYLALPNHFYFTWLNQMDGFRLGSLDQTETPVGLRYHVNPTLGMTKETRYGYIRPSVSLYGSYYDLSRYVGQDKHFSVLLPVSALDMNLFFQKSLSSHWTQTLEPRFFYLYTPFRYQSDIPVFDTGYFFPSYNLLFRTNRFAGFDRIGDANHLSFGLTSRFLHDGREGLRLSLGSSLLFANERVELCESFRRQYCRDNPNQLAFFSGQRGLAPIEAEAEIPLNSQLSLLSNVAWNTRDNQVTNAMMNLHYEPKLNYIVNFSYGFFSNGDAINFNNSDNNNVNLSQFRVSYAWPINIRWRGIGAYSYNVSHRFLMTYLFGLQYDTCCVAVRFLGGRAFRYYNPVQGPVYANNVYLQFLLKGLGSVSTTDPSGVVRTFLPSYRDEFGGGVATGASNMAIPGMAG